MTKWLSGLVVFLLVVPALQAQQIGSALDQRFQETIAATHGAIQAAYVKRKEHTEAIAHDVSQLEAAATELALICVELQKLR